MKIVRIDTQDGEMIEVVVGSGGSEDALTEYIDWLNNARMAAIDIAEMVIKSHESGVNIPKEILHAAQVIEVTN